MESTPAAPPGSAPGSRAGPIARLYRAAMERAEWRLGVTSWRVLAIAFDPARAMPAPAGCELRGLARAELLRFAEDPALGMRPDWIERALARGDSCAGVLERGELAGYLWTALGPTPHLEGIWVDFPARAAWRYKAFVAPRHRGRGIATALYRHGEAGLAAQGRRESLLCIASYNTPSFAAAERAGARIVGTVACLRARGRFLAWHSPGARRHGLRFYLPG